MPQRNAYHRRFSTAAAKSATGSVVNNIHSNGSIPAGSPTSRTNTAHSQTEGQRDLRWGGGNSTWAQSAGEGGGGATGGGGSGASRGRSGRCWSTARKSFGSRSQVMLLHQLIPWPREGRTAPIHQHDFQRAQLRQGTGQRRDLRPLVQNTRRPDWRRAWSGGRQGQKSLLGQVSEDMKYTPSPGTTVAEEEICPAPAATLFAVSLLRQGAKSGNVYSLYDAN